MKDNYTAPLKARYWNMEVKNARVKWTMPKALEQKAAGLKTQ